MSGIRGDGRSPACLRTAGVVDRIIADTLTADDRLHAQTCQACGPVVARAMRFDTELRQTARGFVVEELPRGILDPGLARGLPDIDRERSARSFAPGLAGLAAALLIVALATSVAIAPGGPTPGASSPAESSFTSTLPLFRSSASIARDLLGLKYSCGPGHELATPGPDPGMAVREGLVCATGEKDTEKMAALITNQNEAGDVVAVTIKGEIVGADTEAAIALLQDAFGKLTFLAIADPVVAPQAAEFVAAELPKLQVLPSGDESVGVVGGIRLTLSRAPTGSFYLVLEPPEQR